MDRPDQIVMDLMRRQQGLVSYRQAETAGMTKGQIAQRLRSGRWERIAVGTYRLAGSPLGWRQTARAACMQSPDAVASFGTTAALTGLSSRHPQDPHVTVPYSVRWTSSIAVVHRARLSPVDMTTIDGIPSTTVPRLLVDCAGTLAQDRLDALVNSAMHERRELTAEIVDAAWDRSQRAPGRRGHDRLMAALDDWRTGIKPESAAEVRLIRMLKQWGYPEPDRQIVVIDSDGETIGRVDVGWRDNLIGIEYDSVRWHDADRWGPDEQRHRRIEAAGWTLAHADKADLRPGERSLRDALARLWPGGLKHHAA